MESVKVWSRSMMTRAMTALMLCTLVVCGQLQTTTNVNGVHRCKFYCAIACVGNPEPLTCIYSCMKSCKAGVGLAGNSSPALTYCRIGCLVSACSLSDSEGYEGKRCVDSAASCAEDCRKSYAHSPSLSPAPALALAPAPAPALEI